MSELFTDSKERPPTKEEILALILALQDDLSDLYLNLDQDADPQAFNAGLLAWESVRLFWYSVRGNKYGINEKHDYVLEALRRFELSKEL